MYEESNGGSSGNIDHASTSTSIVASIVKIG